MLVCSSDKNCDLNIYSFKKIYAILKKFSVSVTHDTPQKFQCVILQI